MSILNKIKDSLVDPRLIGVDVNSSEIISIHSEILKDKKMIQDVFCEFYKTITDLDKIYFNLEKNIKRIEMGSGSSFFKIFYPHITTSDIKKNNLIDIVLDVQNMNLEDNSIGAFYGINCFHHFPDPDLFFQELDRTLIKGGGCILIDPYYGPLSSFFYKRVFEFEHFDKYVHDWKTKTEGPSMNANQALSYVVFIRDRDLFKKKYPNLEIVYQKRFLNFSRYLLSGGLNFKQLVPNIFIPVLKFLELLSYPIAHVFALHHVIVIKKIK